MVDRSRSIVVLPYRETVRGSRLLAVIVLISAVATVAGGVAVAVDTNVPTAERVGVTSLMVIVAVVLVFVAAVFTRLRIEVNAARVRWSFGPFSDSVAVEQVAAARSEPYRWLRFGGWGIRYGWGSTGRAYTVPFSRRGVVIERRDGQRFYVSSNAPDDLVAAIESARGSGGASR